YALPTPHWETFIDKNKANRALDVLGPPWMIKADGLAAGKGTPVTRDRREAEAAVQRDVVREPKRIVMEELIDGWEASFIATVAANSDRPPIPESSKSASVVVVLASRGYPENPSTGDPVTLRPSASSNIVVFHAGTARNSNGELVTAGGRVINVTATGPSVESARKDAYSVIGKSVHFGGMHYRTDIGSGQIRRRQLEPIKT